MKSNEYTIIRKIWYKLTNDIYIEMSKINLSESKYLINLLSKWEKNLHER